MKEITQIIATQTDTLNQMKAKSVLALSDSPSADGVNATMIKNAFVQPLWDGDASLVGELGRVCSQVNTAFSEVKTAVDAIEEDIEENYAKKSELTHFSYSDGRLVITRGAK